MSCLDLAPNRLLCERPSPAHLGRRRNKHGRRLLQTLLITGATGMVGRALVARYHDRYHILAQGRDQRSLAQLRACHPGIVVVPGELTSPALADAVEASQLVVHAAGQKHPALAW